MDSSGMIDALMRFLGGHPSMQVGNTTYGDAVSRITRTPIRYANLDNKGEYDPATKAITIDPTKTTDVGATTRHESIHALLDQVPGAAQMAQQSTGYSDIASHFSGGMGNPADEAPAYMAMQPNSPFMGFSDQARQQFLDDFGKKVETASPQAGQTWKRLKK